MREEQREQAALECAQHIIKISRVHADEYRDSWLGGESNLAKDYMRIRNEVKRLREALAACKRVVELMLGVCDTHCETLHHAVKDRHNIGDLCPAETRLKDAINAYLAAVATAKGGA